MIFVCIQFLVVLSVFETDLVIWKSKLRVEQSTTKLIITITKSKNILTDMEARSYGKVRLDNYYDNKTRNWKDSDRVLVHTNIKSKRTVENEHYFNENLLNTIYRRQRAHILLIWRGVLCLIEITIRPSRICGSV